MLQQSDRQTQLFNVFIGVVARFSDSLCFHFGQLMLPFWTTYGSSDITVNEGSITPIAFPNIQIEIDTLLRHNAT